MCTDFFDLLASSSSSSAVLLSSIHLCLSDLLPFKPTTLDKSTPQLILMRLGSSSMDLAASVQPVALINVEKGSERDRQ